MVAVSKVIEDVAQEEMAVLRAVWHSNRSPSTGQGSTSASAYSPLEKRYHCPAATNTYIYMYICIYVYTSGNPCISVHDIHIY